MVVVRTSSVKDFPSNTAIIAFLQLRTRRSHIPPKCGAPGGLKVYLIPFCAIDSSMFARFQAFTHSLISLAAPTKFVPLSLKVVSGLPLRAPKCVIAFTQVSASSEGTTSMCNDLVVKHVKKQHYFHFNFTSLNCNYSLFLHSNLALFSIFHRSAFPGLVYLHGLESYK